ncbi:hypothetical protein AVEN_23194-1 [Araneus ventricosus]|uniref:Uncharacterized protein n=2 Tax=Araneus ventricosus TaxID=182803 RepID=A0A4Y2M061_ARAVE|nr:hypothetical protein AVEN_23194-1 [Araneus ventricosus]
MARLRTSLETGINVKTNDTKGALVVFRTLQILGEVLCTPIENNFIGGFLLSALIPQDLKFHLKHIRHTISHIKPQTIQGKLHLESSSVLIEEIQSELKIIYQIFEPVFSCMCHKMKEFIVDSVTPRSPVTQEELMVIASEREIWCNTRRDEFESLALKVFKFCK